MDERHVRLRMDPSGKVTEIEPSDETTRVVRVDANGYITEIETKGVKMKNNHPWQIGTNYFIRTVTHHYTGRLEAVYQKELVLSECAWIADDGRFHTALSTGQLNEVVPMIGKVIIGRNSIIDASVWIE